MKRNRMSITRRAIKNRHNKLKAKIPSAMQISAAKYAVADMLLEELVCDEVTKEMSMYLA